MALFVLLGQAGVGHAGTAADPFSWADLDTEISSPAPETEFYIGAINDQVYSVAYLSDSVSGSTEFHFYAWNYNNVNPFPPYRIKFTGTGNLSGNWYNCVIEIDGNVYLGKGLGGVAQNFNLYSGYLITNELRVGYFVGGLGYDIGFYGSDLKVNNSFRYYLPYTGNVTTITIKDTICSVASWVRNPQYGTLYINFEHSAVGNTAALRAQGHASFQNSQEYWVNPNPWPASNGTYEDFSFETMLKGVIVALSTSAHTGYTRDLWDENRNTVGATSKNAQSFEPTLYWEIGPGETYINLNEAINALVALGALTINYNIRLIHDNFETIIIPNGSTLDLNGHNIDILNPQNYNTVSSYGIYLRTNTNAQGGKITVDGIIINVIPAGFIPPFPTAIFALAIDSTIVIKNCRINCRDRWDIGIQGYIANNDSTVKAINNMVSGCLRYGIRMEMIAP